MDQVNKNISKKLFWILLTASSFIWIILAFYGTSTQNNEVMQEVFFVFPIILGFILEICFILATLIAKKFNQKFLVIIVFTIIMAVALMLYIMTFMYINRVGGENSRAIVSFYGYFSELITKIFNY